MYIFTKYISTFCLGLEYGSVNKMNRFVCVWALRTHGWDSQHSPLSLKALPGFAYAKALTANAARITATDYRANALA